ncbi:hypothetical protein RchiOBHm_Chr5g0001171 [Rosa chinensis]|uniref:Uncharacterized protein n=1 Tax=Rosa chinensis TaxID=74649 RepID=A0A2P6Q237_ROSCH|nr:hypothetical protein RchiOBHm_Chr5g0001171 [Rosa chinensis]
MSSTYRTKKINLLPLIFRYTHSSSGFSTKPCDTITESNLRYHCLDACFKP